MTQDFQYIPPGLSSELKSMDMGELINHYLTHYRNILFDEHLLESYIARLLEFSDIGNNPEGLKLLFHLLKKYIQLNPFSEAVLNLYVKIIPANRFSELLRFMGRSAKTDSNILGKVQQAINHEDYKKAYGLLALALKENPEDINTANLLAELAIQSEQDLEFVFKKISIPEEYLEDFKLRCVYLCSKHLKYEKALNIWNGCDKSVLKNNEMLCAYLGLAYLGCGKKDEALDLLKLSLAHDKNQVPIQELIKELENPFKVDDNALKDKKITVCLYSYNKADLLKSTLESLCESQIGDSDIVVLLNGCKDNSRELFDQVKEKYPDIPIDLIEMPVNVGAPAARNYLVDYTLKKRKNDYVAFLDDDVTIPVDWLKSLVTALESDGEAGAVGCKILNPEDSSLQYIFRDVSIAKPGVLRLSFTAPLWNLDNGLYNVCREVDTVMGCCHLIRTECLEKVPEFDIRFSPSQLDDVAFHLDLRLLGYKILYLGQLSCVHHRSTGFLKNKGKTTTNGNSYGNDVKFYYRFAPMLEKMSGWQQRRNSDINL